MCAHAGIISLPFDILDVIGHATIARVSRQVSGDYVALVVHSTHEFASNHASTYGSTSATAKLRPQAASQADGNKAREEAVVGLLYADAKGLLKQLAGELPSRPVWGPLLHRWGSAFCAASSSSSPASVSRKHRLALCGDFAAAAGAAGAGDAQQEVYFGVEGAALSGMEVAKDIIEMTLSDA